MNENMRGGGNPNMFLISGYLPVIVVSKKYGGKYDRYEFSNGFVND